MLYGGIPITGALFIMSNVYSNHLIYEKIKKAIDPSLNWNWGPLLFLSKKTPNWKFLIYLIIGIILIYKPNILDIIANTYYFEIIVFFIVIQIFYIIYKIFIIFLVRLSLNNKILIDETFPKFIKNWLSYYIDIPEESKIYYLQLIKREIQIYIGIIIFELIILYLISYILSL